MGLIERYGTGIKRVRKPFLDHGLPAPDFKVVKGGFFVKVFAGAQKSNSSDPNVGVNVGVNKLLEVVTDNPGLNLSKLKVYFDVTDRTLKRWLKELREQGKIEFKGAPKTGGYWKVKS